MLPSRLLAEIVELHNTDRVLLVNSAANPFVSQLAQQVTDGTITLAEDNIATAQAALQLSPPQLPQIQHVAFHNYISHQPASTMDNAIMDLLYQPGNTWTNYGLQVALYALRPHGRLYVVGAKDRGILSIGKRMQECFGNVETLTISKGHRVLCSYKTSAALPEPQQSVNIFAASQLDKGTRLLIDALQVKPDDVALDIGCGAGFLGLYIARHASQGRVTMVDVSLAAVETAQHEITQSGLTNVSVLPSDGAQAVLDQRFDLVVTNPPFHQGGIQTTSIATRFISEAAQVLKPRGRFYLVANRFLKYEPTLLAHFKKVEEVAGNTRYKVLCAI